LERGYIPLVFMWENSFSEERKKYENNKHKATH